MVICLELGADLHMAHLMPLPLTDSCFSKIQTGFTFLVQAYLGSPGKRAVKWVCVNEMGVCIHLETSSIWLAINFSLVATYCQYFTEVIQYCTNDTIGIPYNTRLTALCPGLPTNQVSRYEKGRTSLDFTEARDSEWQWHQLGQRQSTEGKFRACVCVCHFNGNTVYRHSFSLTPLVVAPVDRYSRLMAHMMWTRASMCLLGFSLILLQILHNVRNHRVVIVDGPTHPTNPRWRTSAILKNR